MSRYQGGKQRLGATLATVMFTVLQDLERAKGRDLTLKQTMKRVRYLEPFCGMFGVMRWLAPIVAQAHGCDANVAIVRLWQQLAQGWDPPDFQARLCLETFEWLKKHQHRDDEYAPLRAIVGTACSFGGAYFSGYAALYDKKNGRPSRSYYETGVRRIKALRSIAKQVRSLDPADYKEHRPKGQVIYADPPYACSQTTASNDRFRYFNTVEFWQRMTEWSKTNVVFVSESTPPPAESGVADEWVTVFGREHVRTSNHCTTSRTQESRKKTSYERLFLHRQYADRLSPDFEAMLAERLTDLALLKRQKKIQDATQVNLAELLDTMAEPETRKPSITTTRKKTQDRALNPRRDVLSGLTQDLGALSLSFPLTH